VRQARDVERHLLCRHVLGAAAVAEGAARADRAAVGAHRRAAVSAPESTTAHDPDCDGLQVYIVGGAVRDALLGQPPGDRDWVVVGATPEDMARRGFIPVGGDFPVFLHPRTK